MSEKHGDRYGHRAKYDGVHFLPESRRYKKGESVQVLLPPDGHMWENFTFLAETDNGNIEIDRMHEKSGMNYIIPGVMCRPTPNKGWLEPLTIPADTETQVTTTFPAQPPRGTDSNLSGFGLTMYDTLTGQTRKVHVEFNVSHSQDGWSVLPVMSWVLPHGYQNDRCDEKCENPRCSNDTWTGLVKMAAHWTQMSARVLSEELNRGTPLDAAVETLHYKLSQESIERIQEGHEAIVQRLVSDKARRLLNALSPDVL